MGVEDIDWIEAQAKYSCAHTREGDHPLVESVRQIQAVSTRRVLRACTRSAINLDRAIEVVSTRNRRILVGDKDVAR